MAGTSSSICAALTEAGRDRSQSAAMLAGTLDINASVRARASCASATASIFLLVTFEDVPGFLPGTQQEYGRNHHGMARSCCMRCGSDRAESVLSFAQSLWRSVLRYVVKAHPHRRELCLAERRKLR